MNVTEEMLIAYADGELSGEELREVEAALNSRPELARFVEKQRALRRTIQSVFAPMLTDEVPKVLTRAVVSAPVSPRWRLNRFLAARPAPAGKFALWSGITAAAALACGVIIGLVLAPSSEFRVDRPSGALVADGGLQAALDNQLASSQERTAPIRIGLSFRAKDGHYCRTFESQGGQSSIAGLACRSGSSWSIAALAVVPPQRSEYRMAAAMPDAIRNAVSVTISGAPFDAAAERRARESGWR